MGAGSPSRSAVERLLEEELQALSDAFSAVAPAPTQATVPRRAAVAMALALFSQPHLAATFGPGRRDGTVRLDDRPAYPAEAPLVIAPEGMERALGLSRWELDDLREEVDRRAGHALKRDRALSWLWNHFEVYTGKAAGLFGVLFPGTPNASSAQMVRRANRLYAIAQTPSSPLPSLYLGWLGAEVEGHSPPLASFHSRHVDAGLRRQLARGVGGVPWEVDRLLDQMVVLLPESQAQAFLERDQWRVTGHSVLTSLGDDYIGGLRLLRGIERDGLEWTRWLSVLDGEVVVDRNPRTLFDEFALDRAQAVMSHIYAALMARVEQTDRDDPVLAAEDLDLFDVPRHLRAALQPMLDWARSEDTRAHIAARLRVDRDGVARALDGLADAWEAHMLGRWLAPPTAQRQHTISAILVAHLVATHRGLLRLVHRGPDARWEHRNLALLFVAHYLVEAPIERLWMKTLSDMPHDSSMVLPPPEDIGSTWFWSAWQGVLEEVGQGGSVPVLPS